MLPTGDKAERPIEDRRDLSVSNDRATDTKDCKATAVKNRGPDPGVVPHHRDHVDLEVRLSDRRRRLQQLVGLDDEGNLGPLPRAQGCNCRSGAAHRHLAGAPPRAKSRAAPVRPSSAATSPEAAVLQVTSPIDCKPAACFVGPLFNRASD